MASNSTSSSRSTVLLSPQTWEHLRGFPGLCRPGWSCSPWAEAGRAEGGLSKARAPHAQPQQGSYLSGLEAELRAPLALPVQAQTSSLPQSSKSVQKRENAMGWGSDPICRLGAHPTPSNLGEPEGRGGGMAPLTPGLNVSSEEGYSGFAFLSLRSSQERQCSLDVSLPPPRPFHLLSAPSLQGQDSAASLLSFYLAKTSCPPATLPGGLPHAQKLGLPVLRVWSLVPEPAVNALKLTTLGSSPAESGFSVAEGRGPAYTYMLL